MDRLQFASSINIKTNPQFFHPIMRLTDSAIPIGLGKAFLILILVLLLRLETF